jgi:hypothetical protein
MNQKIIIAFIVVLILIFGFFMIRGPQEDMPNSEEEIIENEEIDEEEEGGDQEESQEVSLKETILDFVGSDYERGPWGEGEDEDIYREDAFDSTTLVLAAAAKYNFPENPEEGIKEIHYYPPGEVSYQTRLHFSSYRNKVSDYFEDITNDVGQGYLKSKSVLLNREFNNDEKLIDIDWEEEVTLTYIPVEDVSKLISRIPEVAGVMFIKDGDQEIGLDVRHEGLLVNQEEFIHASSQEERVVSDDFLSFLEESDYDGVSFFQINKVENSDE